MYNFGTHFCIFSGSKRKGAAYDLETAAHQLPPPSVPCRIRGFGTAQPPGQTGVPANGGQADARKYRPHGRARRCSERHDPFAAPQIERTEPAPGDARRNRTPQRGLRLSLSLQIDSLSSPGCNRSRSLRERLLAFQASIPGGRGYCCGWAGGCGAGVGFAGRDSRCCASARAFSASFWPSALALLA